MKNSTSGWATPRVSLAPSDVVTFGTRELVMPSWRFRPGVRAAVLRFRGILHTGWTQMLEDPVVDCGRFTGGPTKDISTQNL